MQQAVGNNTNPNGCRIPVTYFTMQGYSDCDLIKERWQEGDEIAGHTISHELMGKNYTNTEEEIVGQREWLIACGIPAEDVVGHRSPYLANTPAHREALEKGGFLYDSTINEHWPDSRLPGSEPNSFSPNGKSRLWPYTMDFGIPQNCKWTGNICTEEEKYKGLWEMPVWNIQTDFYPENAYALDPCDNSKIPCNVFNLLKSNFELAYTGNRAPVPLYVHSPWLEQSKNMKDVQKFITWARQEHPNDVYFVTMHQLIQWLQNPVPVSQMDEWLGCVSGGNAAGAVGKSKPSVPVVVPEPVAPQAAVPEPTLVAPLTADIAIAPQTVAPLATAPAIISIAQPVAVPPTAPAAPAVQQQQQQAQPVREPSSVSSIFVFIQIFFVCVISTQIL